MQANLQEAASRVVQHRVREELIIKPIFKQSPLLGLRLIVLLILSFSLFFFEQNSVFFRHIRFELSTLTLPVQKLVDAPVRLFTWLSSTIVTQQHLINDNARLRANELLLEAKLQRLVALQQENQNLHQLLNSSVHLGAKSIVAQLLALDLDPLVQQVIINKGSKNKVYEGQPVLDAYGVMGQITTVGFYTSRVLLISDPRSAIPVQDSRSGVRAIAVGLGSKGLLSLLHVPDMSDIHEGDLLVSSGLGLRFPAGYPVGRVIKVERISGDSFISVTVAPAARLDRTEQVLLIWPKKTGQYEEVQQQLTHQPLVSELPASDKSS